MKNTIKTTIIILSIGLLSLASSVFAGELSADNKQFLSGYEKVRVALAADDLDTAKKTATALGKSGDGVAQSQSLQEARSAFEILSTEAIKLVANQPGFYVVHCGMVNKDWLQTSAQVSNPYLGKEMAGCGEIKK